MHRSGLKDQGQSGSSYEPVLSAPIFEHNERLLLAVVLAAIFLAFQWHLRAVIVSDMDEGTYLYAGQLIAKGLVPYRDFLLAHPPGVALLAAGWFRYFGTTLSSARSAYLIFVLLGTVPLYALLKRLTGSRFSALFALVAYTTGMLMLANMGRTVRLEPLMNAFVIAAVACRFLKPDSLPWAGVMGGLLGIAVCVKANAVLPAALLAMADLAWHRPLRSVIWRWLVAGLGLCLVLGPALAWCLHQPHFVQDVFLSQVHRPRLGLALRVHYLLQNFARYPPIALGLAAAGYLIVKSPDRRVRSLCLIALGNTLLLLVAFKTFFGYYIVQVLPFIAALFAISLELVGRRWLQQRFVPLAYLLVAGLGVLLPLAYAEVYNRTATSHVAGPRAILPLLQHSEGSLYSMYPAFVLWSGRHMYPWYYQADSLVPRINGWISDADFLHAFGESSTLVLYHGEVDDYPLTRSYVTSHFNEVYRDGDWNVWERAGPPARP